MASHWKELPPKPKYLAAEVTMVYRFGTLLLQGKGAYNDSEMVKMKRLVSVTSIAAVVMISPISAMLRSGLESSALEEGRQ